MLYLSDDSNAYNFLFFHHLHLLSYTLLPLNITNDNYKFIFDKESSEIADIFIVSQVERVSEEANNSEIKGISIFVEKADGEKCERCWKYDVEVGKDANHTDVCPRCAEVLNETV